MGHNGSPEWTAIKAQFSILGFQLPWQQNKMSNLYGIFMLGGGLFNKHFEKMFCQNTCNETAIKANFHFSYYKSGNFKLL